MLTGNHEAAADLVQDALERTLNAWPRVRNRDDPEGYVRRTMVNRNVSIWRRRRREHLVDEVPDQARHDDHQLPDKELQEALAALPRKQRAVLVLRFAEDLSERQVADMLGCSVGTVKSQTFKALAKLRARLPHAAPPGTLPRAGTRTGTGTGAGTESGADPDSSTDPGRETDNTKTRADATGGAAGSSDSGAGISSKGAGNEEDARWTH